VQTALADFIKDTPDGREADDILRTCVHCGFCLATCPTYQLLGDELDGPRGRIYLIKQVLEGAAATEKTQLHLDRCLTCRSCETTCPAGVKYGRLLDIGRHVVDKQVVRSQAARAGRFAMLSGLLSGPVFSAALSLGRLVKPILPKEISSGIPDRLSPGPWPEARHPRKMIVPAGCVQGALAPIIDTAMARVLDRIGISLIRVSGGGCCGALPYHLSEQQRAVDIVKRNIDAWWPHIERGAEAIVVTASGCGVMVKDYGHLLRLDADYSAKAKKISELTRDTVEVVASEWARIAPKVAMDLGSRKVAFHSPCTLQHGMKLKGRVEEILHALGLELTTVPDAHLCCGSAGTYSILQPDLAHALRTRKLAALESGQPEVIASANIGCIMHLSDGASVKVRHWIELLDSRMVGGPRSPA
jgi:glycolate dehydrogenase iron-sulfur subunit